jgi:ribosomal protein S12 methylthiotransferase accessory factor
MSPAQGVDWLRALAPLVEASSSSVALNRGWSLEWERTQWQAAAAAGRGHISVRLGDDEALIGPHWIPRTDAGCAACAEVRSRIVLAHPLLENLSAACGEPVPRRPLLLEMLATAVAHLANRPLEPGEVYVVGGRTTRRHRVYRSFDCTVCRKPREPVPAIRRPSPLVLRSRPASTRNPTRSLVGTRLLDRETLRDQVVDARYGPIQQIMRASTTPLAMSEAILPESMAMGYGRALTFGEAESVAVLESYERLAAFPHESPVMTDLAFRDVCDYAVDPATLGRYTPEQLAHPSCRVMRRTDDTPMDWVWGHDLATAQALLVPAEIGFYQYEYQYKLDRFATRKAAVGKFRRFFQGSSSGCAVGSNLEEAALHSLLELAERDAFLLSWHRGVPLPVIAESSIVDPASRHLLDLIDARGFDTHLLAATQDLDVPVVWALAVNRLSPFPATFSSAGSGVDPASAVQSALWELAQILTDPVDWERSTVSLMVDDPWRVETLHDHVRLYTAPESRERATAALGGPAVTLHDAFPGWPEKLRRAAADDVTGALDYVRRLFSGAGMERIVIVDQTTREHADLGIAVANTVVPGIIPMCFGHAQQRLADLPRLTAALAGTPRAHRQAPYDPHPFP